MDRSVLINIRILSLIIDSSIPLYMYIASCDKTIDKLKIVRVYNPRLFVAM